MPQFKLSLLFLVTSCFPLCALPKRHVSPAEIEQLCQQLHTHIVDDGFQPDLIVGLARGGLVPLAYLAGEKCFDIRNTLSLSIKSYEQNKQGNLTLLLPLHAQDILHFKRILIVDDIVDSGKTFNFVHELFAQHFKDATIKTAALFYKPLRSCIKPDYYMEETDDWIVFPWEKEPEA